ncbi:hypothetical protein [Christiangramia forsetii]|uniref:Secreted protein n=2 Tax=Christiangramia forsetii TaxID=411153 RepID=A0M175_CHRFK|nr:hypothetical protein [Christiangramia forsetii]GGG43178.1 hypothetical protein GCM10011532_28930 [Christiangramia forsetii]CAL66370.1 secreted protein [Christiangramia forsetii KT0803]
MKKITILLSAVFLLNSDYVIACELCKKNQPKGFENITHGFGPSGTLDYIIIWSAIIIVGITLFLSVKYLIKPKENNPGHIKNIVKNEGF